MVKTVSVLDLQPQTNTKNDTKNKQSGIDFLELLLSDLEHLPKNNINITNTKNTTDIANENTQNTKAGEAKTKPNQENTNLQDFLETLLNQSNNQKTQTNQEFLKEIKNILSSNFKQQNIILSKSQQKQFSQINNLKDLINFAKETSLNIKKIKITLPKNTETKDSLNTKNLTKTKPSTKEVLSKKISTKTDKNQIKTEISIQNKDQKTGQITSKTFSIHKIIVPNNKTEQKQNSTKQNENQKIDLASLLGSKKTTKTQTKPLQAIPTPNHIQNHTNTQEKQITLETLLNKDIDKKQNTDKKNKQDIQISANQNQINEVKAKAVQAKETINHFKTNLDEAIKNYKPPISKVEIELNPKNLGKVEVSIVQKGNNIQIHMNSDTNNMALFQTHQTEFRQALSSIGFSNIDMNFNSNQDKDRKQNQAKKTYKENEEIESFNEIEIHANYQYA